MANAWGIVYTAVNALPFLTQTEKMQIMQNIATLADALSDGGLPQGSDASIAARLNRMETANASAYRNVRCTNNATTPLAKVDAHWDTLTIGGYAVGATDLTCDLTVVGLNGRDVSTALATGWYYLWAVYDPTTQTAGLVFSASGGALPTAPTLTHASLVDFTAYRFLGEWRQTGTTAALALQMQLNADMSTCLTDVGPGFTTWQVVSGVAVTTTVTTPGSLSTYFPPTARLARLGGLLGTPQATTVALYLRAHSAGGTGCETARLASGGPTALGRPLWIPLTASQQFQWSASLNGGGTLAYVDVLGWKVGQL